jgi:hypothetical protein
LRVVRAYDDPKAEKQRVWVFTSIINVEPPVHQFVAYYPNLSSEAKGTLHCIFDHKDGQADFALRCVAEYEAMMRDGLMGLVVLQNPGAAFKYDEGKPVKDFEAQAYAPPVYNHIVLSSQ